MVLVTVAFLCLCSSLFLCFSPVIGLFVPCFLACSSPVLVSSRSFFVFLLSFSVFCVCFSSAFPWFSFCSRYLLCFSFFACVCPLSLGLFFLLLFALTCSVFLCLFFCSWLCFGLNFPLFSPLIFLFLFWVYFSVLSPQKLPFFLWFSAPFIETQLLASNQSCLYRTVIFPDEIVGERRGPRSDLLQIISFPAESGAPLLKRDGEDARLLATVPFR